MKLYLKEMVASAAILLGTTLASSAADKLDEVKSRGKIIIGVQTDYPDWGYLDPKTGEITGFEVDLANLISGELLGAGVKAELVPVNAQTRTTLLNTDRVDMLSALVTITPARMEQIRYSTVYYLSGQTLVVKRDSDITDVKDLAGKSICVNLGSSEEQNIRILAPNSTILTYAKTPDSLLALKGGRCDAMTSGRSVLAIIAKSDPSLKMVGGVMTFSPIGMGFKKVDDSSLVDAVDAILAKIGADGRYQALYKQWFGEDVPSDYRDWYGMKPEEASARFEASLPKK